jgi:hypothetical protein
MRDVPPQRISIIIVKLWHVLEVRRALSHQSTFAQEWDLSLRIKAVLSSELVYVRHELISRDADERVLDLAGDVLGHCDDALLASAVVVGAVVDFGESIVLKFGLFGHVHGIVTGCLSVGTQSGKWG